MINNLRRESFSLLCGYSWDRLQQSPEQKEAGMDGWMDGKFGDKQGGEDDESYLVWFCSCCEDDMFCFWL